MKKLLFLLVISCSFSCRKTDEDIVSARQWKHGSGAPVMGDWVSGSKLKISGDTVFKDDEPVAEILEVGYNIDHYVLELRSLNDNEKGTYVDKGRIK